MHSELRKRLGLTLGVTVVGVMGLGALPSQAEEVPPSVVFLLDNNESMQDFHQYLPEVGNTTTWGCTDPALVSAMSWFNKSSPDPKLNGSIPYDSDPEFGATPQFFDPSMYYQSRGRRLGWVVEDYPFSLSWDFKQTDGNSDAMMACFRALRWQDRWIGSPELAECQRCLSDKGWWRGPLENNPSQRADIPTLPTEARRVWVLSGRVLNVRPPKFVVARKVLKDVIASTNDMRMGVATYGPDNGWYDPPQLLSALRPTCDQSFPITEAALNRPALLTAVNQVLFRNNERSIGEALFGLGGYFSSQKVDNRWGNWFVQPLNPGWGWPGANNGGTTDNPYTLAPGNTWAHQQDEWTKWAQPWEGTGFDKSVCREAQTSAVVVLSGGEPRYDNSVPITKMMQLLISAGAQHPNGTPLTFDASNPQTNPNPGGVNYCNLFGATQEDCDYTAYNWPTGLARTNKNFMDDTAFFLSHADLRGDMAGRQSVRTFVIGYGDGGPMLQSIALAGQGRYYRVNQAKALHDALTFSLGEIRASSTP
jgi:type IV pilus assembly protein PilY1